LKRVIATAVLFIVSTLCFSQQIPKPLQRGEEAPETLLTTSINDVEVSLFIRGSWQAELVHSGIVQIIPFVYSGVPLLFKQVPDVYLFLALAESLWFEAQIGNDPDNNKFSAGYYKQLDDVLLSIRVGNSNISIKNESFPGLGNPASSFGIKADVINTQTLNHAEAMLRWDTVQYETYTYYGYSEETKLSINPAQWLRGKAFVLPAQAQIVSLYTIDRGQSSLVFPDTYDYYQQTGILILKNPVTKELRAVIRENAAVYELILFLPDDTNPLELKNVYSIPADTSAQACSVINKDSNTVDSNFTTRTVSANTIMVVRNNAEDPHTDDFSRPFYADNPWIYDATQTNSASSFVIITNVLEARESIVLSEAVIPGSITVYRNGLETTSFSYDSTTHTLTVSPPPLPTDKLIITCKKYSTNRNNGQLVAAAGYMANLSEFSTLDTILSGIFAVPEDFSLISIEKLYGGLLWSYDRSYDTDRALLVNAAYSAQFSQSSPVTLPVSERWKPTSFMHIGGTPVTVSTATTTDTFLLPETNIEPKLLVLSYDKTAAGTSVYLVCDTNIRLENYETIGFYIQNTSSDPAAELTLELGTGTNSLRIESIPIGNLPANEWIHISINIKTGMVLCYDTHNSPLSISSITGKIPEESSVAFNTLKLYLNDEPSSFILSEPVLYNPLPNFRMAQEGSLTWMQRYASISLHEQLYWHDTTVNPLTARGEVQAFWKLGFFETTLGSILFYTDARVIPAFHSSIRLEPDLFPFSFQNQFSFAREPDRFSQGISGTLSTPFPVTVSASSIFSSGTITQTWKLATGRPEFIAINSELKQQWVHSLSQFDFFSAYTDSWATLVTFTDPEVFYRNLKITMVQKTIGLTLQARSLYSIYKTEKAGSDFQIELAPQFTFPAGSITPSINKSYSIRTTGSDDSFASAIDTWLATFLTVAAAQCMWEPFFTNTYAQSIIIALAEYPQAQFNERYGLSFQRSLGYGLWDLVIPALIKIESFSEYQQHGSVPVQKLGISGIIGAKAGNIFSQYGYIPYFTAYTFDEYQWKLSTTIFGFPQTNSAIYFTIQGNLQAYFTGNSKFNTAITCEYTEAEYGRGFSCSVTGENRFPVHANSVSWITELIRKQLPDPYTETAQEKAFVSTWLIKLSRAGIQAEDSWKIGASYSTLPAQSTLILEESYSAESFLDTFLRVTLFIKLEETLKWQTERFMFSIGYSLGLSLKAVF